MKFRLISPVGTSLGLIAAVVYACSSDGGSEGQIPAAGGSAGSSAGSSGKGGSGGSVADAGESGAGGEPAMPKAGDVCLTCLADNSNSAGIACAALSDCEDSTLCAPWLACVRTCATDLNGRLGRPDPVSAPGAADQASACRPRGRQAEALSLIHI